MSGAGDRWKAGALLALGAWFPIGCNDAGDSGASAASARRAPRFHARLVRAAVVPAGGDALTTFRVRIRSPQFVGIRGRAIFGYEARLFNHPMRNAASCIIDTGGFLVRGEREIVLDPRRQMGGRWCRGPFRGTLSYYSGFACPPRGACRPPRGFPERRRRVARLSFRVDTGTLHP